MTLRSSAALSGRYFGTAIGYNQGYAIYNEAAYANIADTEFSLIQCENQMKFYALQPEYNTFNFSTADQYVTRAKQKGQVVFGQVLAWHAQLPAWLTELDEEDVPIYDATARQAILQNHITTVVQHFGTDVYAWDVVNEAPDGGVWVEAFGSIESMLDNAFIWARAANPNVKLYYNDYGFEMTGQFNARSVAIYNLISGALSRGVPIDGMGFQCHFYSPITQGQLNDFAFKLNAYASLGLEIHLTELDIARNGQSYAQQAQDFYNVVDVACRFPAVKAISTWGFTDKYTWRTGTEPLLYDANYVEKLAYGSVVSALEAAKYSSVTRNEYELTITAWDNAIIYYRWNGEGEYQTYTTTLTTTDQTSIQYYAEDEFYTEAAKVFHLTQQPIKKLDGTDGGTLKKTDGSNGGIIKRLLNGVWQ